MTVSKVSAGEFAGRVGVLTVSVLFRGFVLSMLWKWFVVATFGVAALSIPAAIGFAVILNYILGNVTRNDKSGESVSEVMGSVIGTSTVVLLFGWIVSLFM